MHFNKGKKKVIIKEIDFEYLKTNYRYAKALDEIKDVLTDEYFVEMYNKTIKDLRNEGVNLPKMFAIIHEGKIKIVSQYFGNKETKTKFLRIRESGELTETEISDLADVWAKTINANYIPSPDMAELFNSSIIPFDLDSQVISKIQSLVYKQKHPELEKELFAENIYLKLEKLKRIYRNTDFTIFIAKVISQIKDDALKTKLINCILNGTKYLKPLNYRIL